jgi:DNA gyrase subunit B
VFDYEVLLKRLREQAFLNGGVNICLRDERAPLEDGTYREDDLEYEGGIKSFVEYINEQKHCELIHPEVIYMRAEKDNWIAEVAMQYNDSYNEALLTFANNINTIEGGTHEIGYKTALTKVFNDYGRKYG